MAVSTEKRESSRILIHPEFDGTFAMALMTIWQAWINEGNCQVLESGNPLTSTSFLDDQEKYPAGTELIIGGQKSDACVTAFLFNACRHQRVKNGELRLAISKSALYGNSIEPSLRLIEKTMKVTIRLID